MPHGSPPTSATCVSCGGWRFHFKLPEDGKCICGARFSQQDIALAKMLRDAASKQAEAKGKGKGKGGGDAKAWPWRAATPYSTYNGGKNAGKGDNGSGGGKGGAKGQGRAGKGGGKKDHSPQGAPSTSGAIEGEASEVATGSVVGSSASSAPLSPTICLDFLQSFAKKQGLQTDALQALAEQLPNFEEEAEKAEEPQPETAASQFKMAKKNWFKLSDAHLKEGKKLQQCQSLAAELETKLEEANRKLEEARKDFNQAATKVDDALALLLVKQRLAATEKQLEITSAGAKQDEFTKEAGWETIGKGGKTVKHPKKPEPTAPEKIAWESFQAMLVERARLVTPAAAGVALPGGDGEQAEQNQLLLRKALEDALAKCDAAAAAGSGGSTGAGEQLAGTASARDEVPMEDVSARRKRDAGETTEELEDAAANDEELQRIKKIHEERRQQFENQKPEDAELGRFPAFLADDDQHL